jgi:hypothetical protein
VTAIRTFREKFTLTVGSSMSLASALLEITLAAGSALAVTIAVGGGIAGAPTLVVGHGMW